jgi:tetratricopeptide (TPR) repeat protein
MENNLNSRQYPKYAKHLIVLFVFILGVLLFYGNTIQNGFIHDDHGQVETNVYIQSIKYLPKMITGCIWESALGECQRSQYYRPMQSLSYFLSYMISSGPWIFHIVNLIYFIAVIFLLFLLVNLLTKNFLVSFLSGLIFLIHPLNTEVVNWIASAPELLYVAFCLLAVIFYFFYREKKNSRYLILVYIFYLLAIFSKEPAVFLPFVFLALDLAYFKKDILELMYWKEIKPYVISVGLFLFYMSLRFWVVGPLSSNPDRGQTAIQHVHTFITLFASYVEKMFWPYPLYLHHIFYAKFQFLNIEFFVSLIILLAFLGLCFWAWKKKLAVLFVWLVWGFVFLFPSIVFVSSIGENLFAERHAFASTITFSVICAIILAWLWQKGKLFKAVALAILGIAIVLSFVVVYQRNVIWKNDFNLFTDTLSRDSNADPIRYNLALYYRDNCQPDKAKEEFQKIIDRGEWRLLYQVYNNLGDIYRSEGNYEKAMFYFEKSLEKNSNHTKALNNLGMVYFEKGDVLKSLTYFCKAVLIDPNFQTAGTNYDNAISAVQGVDNANLPSLYNSIIKDGLFKPSEDNNITLKIRDCSSATECSLIFAGKFDTNEFLFGFMILGKTTTGQVIRPTSAEFDPATNYITLGIDPQFKNASINFIFPTCDGIYYKVAAP